MGIEAKPKNETHTGELLLGNILDDDRTIDSNNWKGHEEQINQIFSLYREKVNPLISVYNALENSFPIGVINELRDVFSHMTQSLLAKESTEIDRHLDKAQRHLKRAVVDAFKYASMAYSKIYDDFKESYKYVDLSYVDNGELLPKLTKLNAEAENLMHKAKMIESDIHNVENMYAAYESAFDCYAELYHCIMDAMENTEKIKLKTIENEKAQKKEHRIDRIIGVVGVAVGIAGIIIGLLI